MLGCQVNDCQGCSCVCNRDIREKSQSNIMGLLMLLGNFSSRDLEIGEWCCQASSIKYNNAFAFRVNFFLTFCIRAGFPMEIITSQYLIF
jgi:hypothetical protein